MGLSAEIIGGVSMTIAVAVRTGSAVVFAADSKITTSGIIGYEENGSPRWVEQTYDNATKVVHDGSKTLMALVAGEANIGQETATDFIMTRGLSNLAGPGDQNAEIAKLVSSMVERKRAYWETTQVPSENWPGPTLLLAAPASSSDVPRVWRVRLDGPDSAIEEVLTSPGIRLEGSYNEAFGLLYGFHPEVLTEVTSQLGVDMPRVGEAVKGMKVPRPIEKLSLWSMPIQDAIDLAVFLATVQIEMDRFLPGVPACGGPIDVMVLRMVPERAILVFPGKVLHHPLISR